MEISPKDLYKDYTNDLIDAESLIEQLSSLIENSKSNQVRIQSIQTFGRLNLKSDNFQVKSQNIVFHLLENLLISDSNELIRNEAATILNQLFTIRSLTPMKWALLYDDSPLCLESVHKSLMEILDELNKANEEDSYSILKSEVSSIRDKEFKITIQTNEKELLAKPNLIRTLTNYYTFLFLKKVYWRIKYKVKNATIVELDFSFKVLSRLPPALRYLQSLEKLTLKYNQILQLPDWIGELTSLTDLNLNINNITKLPSSISMLGHLEELSLWKNELEELPENICNLTHLKKLNLRLNQLTNLPELIGNLTELKHLDMHDNRLSSLPKSIKHLKSLELLNLSWNLLKELPEEMYDLYSLKVLDLERNELKTISPLINRLKSLEFLNLSDNKLNSLPSTIGNLNSLKSLNLSRNQLVDLPRSILSLPLLEELYLINNEIEEFPLDLQEFEKRGLKIIT